MTVPAPEAAAVPASMSVTYLEQMPDRGMAHHHVWQRLADNLGRDVHVLVPHTGRGIGANYLREQFTSLRRTRVDPFLLLMYTVPHVDLEGVYSRVTTEPHARSLADGEPPDVPIVLTQGVSYATPVPGDFDTLRLIDAMLSYGEEIGSQFRGEWSLDWFYENLNEPPEITVDAIQPIRGWLFDDAAFIPYDIPHYVERSEIFAEMMVDDLLMVYADQSIADLSTEERLRRIAERREEQERRIREQRIEEQVASVRTWATSLARQQVEQARRELDQAISHRDAQLSIYMDQVRAADRALAIYDGAQRNAKGVDEGDLLTLRKMLDRGTITDLEIQRQTLIFTTRMLYAQDDRTGAYHEIGRCRVRVSMYDGSMVIENLTHTNIRGVGGGPNAAPHVMVGGRPCVGSFAEMVAQYVSEGDWIGMIDGTLNFLESVNTEDIAGSFVYRWPFVEHPEEVGLPPYEGEVRPIRDGGDDDEDEDEDDDYEEDDL